MTAISKLWPQDRLDALWSLQRRARRDGNRVTVKAYADGMMHLVRVQIGDQINSFNTVSEAATWYDENPGKAS